MKALILIISLFLALSCASNKEFQNYEYFTVDSVRADGLYEILIRDLEPCMGDQIMMFPTGVVMTPESYEHYVRITYKSDSIWAKGDTLILIRKK